MDCPGFGADGCEVSFDVSGGDFAVVFQEGAEGSGDGGDVGGEVGEDCCVVDGRKDEGFFVVVS